jgi:hypothetical protein
MIRGVAAAVVIVVVTLLSWMVIVDAAVFEVEKRQGEVDSRNATSTIP